MRLSLNASQVAALCGVTLRQVIHWADRGYLPRASQDSGAFTGQAVDMCMLIKEARARGWKLHALGYGQEAMQSDLLSELATRTRSRSSPA